MLGKTHRAFGVATMATSGLVYHAVTGTDITRSFIPDIGQTNPVIPISDVFALANTSMVHTFAAFLLILGAIFGASYPDIDRNLPIRHRGFTHTVWMLFILIGIYKWLEFMNLGGVQATHAIILPYAFGFIVGYCSHLIADAFSTSGIAWFYPLQQYKDCGNGASVVKGNRFIFQPIYKVGQTFFGIPGSWIWKAIAIIVSIIWLLGIGG